MYQLAKNQFIPSFILDIQPIFESCEQSEHRNFWPPPPKTNQLSFNFHEITSLFYHFVLETYVIYKSRYLIGWEHFDQYLTTRFLPNSWWDFWTLVWAVFPNFSQFTKELGNWDFWRPHAFIFCQIEKIVFPDMVCV